MPDGPNAGLTVVLPGLIGNFQFSNPRMSLSKALGTPQSGYRICSSTQGHQLVKEVCRILFIDLRGLRVPSAIRDVKRLIPIEGVGVGV